MVLRAWLNRCGEKSDWNRRLCVGLSRGTLLSYLGVRAFAWTTRGYALLKSSLPHANKYVFRRRTCAHGDLSNHYCNLFHSLSSAVYGIVAPYSSVRFWRSNDPHVVIVSEPLIDKFLASTNNPSSKEDAPDLNKSFDQCPIARSPIMRIMRKHQSNYGPNNYILKSTKLCLSYKLMRITIKREDCGSSGKIGSTTFGGKRIIQFLYNNYRGGLQSNKNWPIFLQQVLACQRFDQESWQNIKLKRSFKLH